MTHLSFPKLHNKMSNTPNSSDLRGEPENYSIKKNYFHSLFPSETRPVCSTTSKKNYHLTLTKLIPFNVVVFFIEKKKIFASKKRVSFVKKCFGLDKFIVQLYENGIKVKHRKNCIK